MRKSQELAQLDRGSALAASIVVPLLVVTRAGEAGALEEGREGTIKVPLALRLGTWMGFGVPEPVGRCVQGTISRSSLLSVHTHVDMLVLCKGGVNGEHTFLELTCFLPFSCL